jgi:predicted dehydrogenase
MKPIMVGVIGTGFIGPAHVEALRRIPGIEVVAIAENSEELATRKANELCIPKAFGDYRAMLKLKEIDAVHVCTPNHLHHIHAKDALAAGKHVVCEKPLAVTVPQAQELVSLADASGLVCAVHFNIRYYPLMAHVRAMIRSGELGDIYSVQGSYLQDWLFYDTDYNWRLEPELSGESRAVADIGSHWMDLVENLTGLRIGEVCSDFATMHKTRRKPLKPVETYAGKMLKPEDYAPVPIATEDYATVMLRFDGGAHGVLTVSQVSAGRKNRLFFEIDGSKKSVAWESERPNQLWIGRRDGPNELLLRDPSLVHPDSRSLISFPGGHNEGFPDTSKQLFKQVYAAIRGSAPGTPPPYPTFRDGLRELVLCTRILESSRVRKWVEVPAEEAKR